MLAGWGGGSIEPHGVDKDCERTIDGDGAAAAVGHRRRSAACTHTRCSPTPPLADPAARDAAPSAVNAAVAPAGGGERKADAQRPKQSETRSPPLQHAGECTQWRSAPPRLFSPRLPSRGTTPGCARAATAIAATAPATATATGITAPAAVATCRRHPPKRAPSVWEGGRVCAGPRCRAYRYGRRTGGGYMRSPSRGDCTKEHVKGSG